MEWDDSSDYSDSDVESVWSSDEEARPARDAELRRALFSDAELPDDAPRNDMRLRKQETSYAHARVGPGSAILPPHARDPRLASLDEAFGTPRGEDREVAGLLVDEHGNPYAQILESKPPPPNTNRHGQNHQKQLRRVLGYDPHVVVHKKTEAEAITNGADVLNGDADLADPRRATQSARIATGDAFHNQTHTHDFADVDSMRGALYDGYNTGAAAKAFEKRRHHVEHTWRNTVRQEHDPVRAATQAVTQLTSAPVYGHASTTRKENVGTFHRVAHANHSTVQLDVTMDIPVVNHQSQREASGSHDRFQTYGTGDRVQTGHADHLDGEREMKDVAPTTKDVYVSARRAEAVGVQRVGGDAQALERKGMSTTLSGLGYAQPATVGDHIVPEDVVAQASSGNAHTAVQGSTATSVGHDTLDPHRASTDHHLGITAMPLAGAGGGGNVSAGSAIDIGADRPLVMSKATWHFSTAQGGAAAPSAHRAPQVPIKALAGSCMLKDRLAQPHAKDRHAMDHRIHPTDSSGDASGRERLTPVPHERHSNPPSLQAHVMHGALTTRSHGRSTPMTREIVDRLP